MVNPRCDRVNGAMKWSRAAHLPVPDAPTRRSPNGSARLAPDQRAAATAPPGPVLCVAPAGSGKTTTLVARVAWLVDGGADAGTICVVAFNRRAAEELTDRLDAALAPLGCRRVRPGPDVPRARPRDARARPASRSSRSSTATRSCASCSRRPPRPTAAGWTSRSRGSSWTSGSTADDVAGDPLPGPIASAFVAYERAIAELGGVDFDDLVVRALGLLQCRCARAGRVARPLRPAARRRGAGPRPDPAGARAAARGAGERRVPGGRRRPVDLRLAARRRATGPRPRGVAARPATRRPRDELPLPAARRRARGPARRAQPRAIREADPRRDRTRRAGWSSRPTPADDLVRVHARDADLARRRVHPRDPRPHEPRAAGRRRRRGRPRHPVPRARPAAPDRGRPRSTACSIERSRRRRRRAAGRRCSRSDGCARTLREEAAANDEDRAHAARRRGRSDAGRPGGRDARLGGAAAHARGAAIRDRGAPRGAWPSSGATTRR